MDVLKRVNFTTVAATIIIVVVLYSFDVLDKAKQMLNTNKGVMKNA